VKNFQSVAHQPFSLRREDRGFPERTSANEQAFKGLEKSPIPMVPFSLWRRMFISFKEAQIHEYRKTDH
jgi:hypothetical protein